MGLPNKKPSRGATRRGFGQTPAISVDKTYHSIGGPATAAEARAQVPEKIDAQASKITSEPSTATEPVTTVSYTRDTSSPRRRRRPRPSELKDGTAIRYWPIVGWDEKSFRGEVRGAPFRLGDKTWVVHLRNMEPAYGEYVGLPGRVMVWAATLEALRLEVSP